MALFVGTSGWAYKEWKGGFYPGELPQARFLEYYSRALGACEINATFYRLQSAGTFSRWARATPDEFRFAVKAHRRLTHGKQVAPDGDASFLSRFLESLAPLGERLACVLFQFPPYRQRDDEGLDTLLASLPSDLQYAFEFRHNSWESGDVARRVGAAGGTVCFSDSTGAASSELPPGPIAYVRLRASRYSEAERKDWITLLEREAERRNVYAFAKHRDVPANDPFTGVGLAQWITGQVAT